VTPVASIETTTGVFTVARSVGVVNATRGPAADDEPELATGFPSAPHAATIRPIATTHAAMDERKRPTQGSAATRLFDVISSFLCVVISWLSHVCRESAYKRFSPSLEDGLVRKRPAAALVRDVGVLVESEQQIPFSSPFCGFAGRGEQRSNDEPPPAALSFPRS
jgi:hypothetical protein